jgi:hypothetical protein
MKRYLAEFSLGLFNDLKTKPVGGSYEFAMSGWLGYSSQVQPIEFT